MAKKKLTENEEKEMKLLQANYEMLSNTCEEAKIRGNADAVKRIEIAIQDVISQISKIDKKMGDKLAKDLVSQSIIDNKMELNSTIENDLRPIEQKIESIKLEEIPILNEIDETIVDNTDMQYDIIPLPSKGECYAKKIQRLPVGYLTAYDENIITSPNLYHEGLVIDFLLKNKVLRKDFNVDELCSGDVDAITLFLRATSYGNEFPILVKDPNTGKEFETVIDLSEIKFKDFNLIGDENGYFDFELPLTKDKVKFRFLTRKDEKKLNMISLLELESSKAKTINENIHFFKESLKNDKILSSTEKQEFLTYLNKFSDWAKRITEKQTTNYSKIVTNKLEMSIVSVNGNEDRDYIAKYVNNMPARDSLSLRKYIIENEPGVNFEITVTKPESLGGGSFKTFLDWDDSVFLNIS